MLSESILSKKLGSESWPCGIPSDKWDTYGIKKNKISLNKPLCRGGYNMATTKRNLIPVYQPNIFK